MLLYVVGYVNPENVREWEFCGVFDNEECAKFLCETEYYFVGPIELNQQIPNKSVEWPGSYYPKRGGVNNGENC